MPAQLATSQLSHKYHKIQVLLMLLTWTSSVVKNSPASAGDTGSTPSLGRFHMPQSSWAHVPQLLKTVCPPAHIPQPLSLRAAATEALVPRVCTVQQEKPLQ